MIALAILGAVALPVVACWLGWWSAGRSSARQRRAQLPRARVRSALPPWGRLRMRRVRPELQGPMSDEAFERMMATMTAQEERRRRRSAYLLDLAAWHDATCRAGMSAEELERALRAIATLDDDAQRVAVRRLFEPTVYTYMAE